MAQQTAVEWLFDKLDVIIELDSTKWDKIAESVAKAKEMEKQQKKAAWVDGIKTQRIIKSTEVDKYFEQYYTQTYGK
jgi:hypothetical protein